MKEDRLVQIILFMLNYAKKYRRTFAIVFFILFLYFYSSILWWLRWILSAKKIQEYNINATSWYTVVSESEFNKMLKDFNYNIVKHYFSGYNIQNSSDFTKEIWPQDSYNIFLNYKYVAEMNSYVKTYKEFKWLEGKYKSWIKKTKIKLKNKEIDWFVLEWWKDNNGNWNKWKKGNIVDLINNNTIYMLNRYTKFLIPVNTQKKELSKMYNYIKKQKSRILEYSDIYVVENDNWKKYLIIIRKNYKELEDKWLEISYYQKLKSDFTKNLCNVYIELWNKVLWKMKDNLNYLNWLKELESIKERALTFKKKKQKKKYQNALKKYKEAKWKLKKPNKIIFSRIENIDKLKSQINQMNDFLNNLSCKEWWVDTNPFYLIQDISSIDDLKWYLESRDFNYYLYR